MEEKEKESMELVKTGIKISPQDHLRPTSVGLTRGQSVQHPASYNEQTLLKRNSSITSRDGVTMAVIPLQRKTTVILRESSVNQKDSEVDWRDRLR